jgi:hypothetical protein
MCLASYVINHFEDKAVSNSFKVFKRVMKLKLKHKIAIIIAFIPVIGGLITAVLIGNNKHEDIGVVTSENKNPITVVIDNKPPPVKETNLKNNIISNELSDRILILEKLKKEGKEILDNYIQRKNDFNNWKSKCRGILKESDSEIEKKLQDIEEQFVTNDYHSQIIKIIELLDSEIINQKTKSK